MKQKRVNFRTKVPAIAAVPMDDEAAASAPSERDGWVSHGREDEADSAHDVAAPAPVRKSAMDDPALRIARVMPIWLGWYFIVATMTEFLSPAHGKRGLK